MNCVKEKICHDTCNHCDDYLELETLFWQANQKIKEMKKDRLSLLEKNYELTMKIQEVEFSKNEDITKCLSIIDDATELIQKLKLDNAVLENEIKRMKGLK